MNPTLFAGVALLVSLTLVGVLPAAEPNRQEPVKLTDEVRARCLETLRKGLKSHEFWPSIHAAEALTLAGAGDEVLAVLRERLPKERDDQHRCGLARELVRAGDRSHLPLLFEILGDAKSKGQVHAAESLYKIGEVGDGKQLRTAFEQTQNLQLQLLAAAALAKSGQADALELLRKQVLLDDKSGRFLAAFALGRLGGAQDIELLLKALESEKDAATRGVIVIALACLGNAKGRVELGRGLDSTDADVRTMSADFVGQSRSVEYHARLIRLLDDAALDTRLRAAQSLLALSLPAKKR